MNKYNTFYVLHFEHYISNQQAPRSISGAHRYWKTFRKCYRSDERKRELNMYAQENDAARCMAKYAFYTNHCQ